jgi:hypothetical protein
MKIIWAPTARTKIKENLEYVAIDNSKHGESYSTGRIPMLMT